MIRKEIFDRLLDVAKEPNKILLLTHTDLDGAGAAIVVSMAYHGSKVDVKHCNNNEMSDAILSAVRDQADDYDLILAADISVTEADAEIVSEYVNKNFLLFDHHPTAKHLNKYDWACVYDGKIEDSSRATYYDLADEWHTSATGLLYDYFAYHEFKCTLEYPALGYFAYAVSAYDTWDWKTTKCNQEYIQELNSLCYILGLAKFERCIKLRIVSDEKLILPIDRLLFELEQDKIDIYLSKIKDNIIIGSLEVMGETYSYAGCVSTDYIAQTFEYLRENNPNCDLLIVNTGSSVSLRTNTNVNLAVIAKHFGGGGHTAASGFPISIQDKHEALVLPFSSSSKTSVFS